jgi:hypothetical protein
MWIFAAVSARFFKAFTRFSPSQETAEETVHKGDIVHSHPQSSMGEPIYLMSHHYASLSV